MKFAAVLLITGVLTGSLAACSWVKVRPEAVDIQLKPLDQMTGCKYLGTATGKTRSKVGFINRNADKVRAEVLDLARNEALDMSGDTLVKKGELVDGRQTFAVYRCRP